MSTVCRFCGSPLTHTFADLGVMPPANAYVTTQEKEVAFPLRVHVCDCCLLVQTEMAEIPENIFSDYAYFSSMSNTWLEHCRRYCVQVITDYALHKGSFVVEVASNDGYLLKNFVERGIPVLGVEPAKNIAKHAVERGVSTLNEFFSERMANYIAEKYGKADLLIGNNVFAHVPAINDFTKGLKALLKDGAVLTLEFPNIKNLISNSEFDTIYHEHYYYFSLLAVQTVFERHGLRVFHVESLPTHGGSYRVYGCHMDDVTKPTRASVEHTLQAERAMGLDRIETYAVFSRKMKDIKHSTLSFLSQKKQAGKRIVAFGAPAKGATFLNYCGIGPEIIEYTVDETPYKQGLCIPGVRIPIFPLEKLLSDTPDYVVILPWNWKDEVLRKLQFMKAYGGKAVTLIPEIREFE